MRNSAVEVPVEELAGEVATGRARAVEERAIRLEVNGRPAAAWTYTPERPDALAAGWLLAEGYVDSREELEALEVAETPRATVVRARVPAGRAAEAEAERRRRAEAGVADSAVEPGRGPTAPGPSDTTEASARQLDGGSHIAGASAAARANGTPAAVPPLAAFPELFRSLYAAADRYQDTGGIHAAALSDGERLLVTVEDIGRHNAVDKAIGLALLGGEDFSRLGLVLTARVSGEIARKVARAGFAWVASRSVPTSLAVEIAGAAGIPIVARAASREPFVHGGRRG